MKITLYLVLPILFIFCKGPEKAPISKIKKGNKTVQLHCILKGCQAKETLSLYSFEGIAFKKMQEAKVSGDTFRFEIPASSPQFLYVGVSETKKRAVILGNEAVVKLEGNCKDMQRVKTVQSDINKRYESYRTVNLQLKGEMNQAVRGYQRNARNPEKRKVSEAQMVSIDKKRTHMLDSLKKTQPMMAKIMALETFVSYATDKKGYSNEVEHFIKEFFSSVDLSDADYNNIPPLFEAFKNYAQTLTTINLPPEELVRFVDGNLNKIPAGSKAYNYALGGVLLGLQAKNHPGFLDYGARFVELHKKDASPAVKNLQLQLEQAKQFMPGAVAPDFTQNTPEGTPLTLSSLRGKVVLVDFWASWCGPCRKENPHVRKVYDKYKDKGFEILGVSLDKNKERWLSAIDKDGLPWHHVSDLRGWSNKVAQAYSVRSIPATVLLDRKGRIIARNFRAAQLEQHLARIFKE